MGFGSRGPPPAYSKKDLKKKSKGSSGSSQLLGGKDKYTAQMEKKEKEPAQQREKELKPRQIQQERQLKDMAKQREKEMKQQRDQQQKQEKGLKQQHSHSSVGSQHSGKAGSLFSMGGKGKKESSSWFGSTPNQDLDQPSAKHGMDGTERQRMKEMKQHERELKRRQSHSSTKSAGSSFFSFGGKDKKDSGNLYPSPNHAQDLHMSKKDKNKYPSEKHHKDANHSDHQIASSSGILGGFFSPKPSHGQDKELSAKEQKRLKYEQNQTVSMNARKTESWSTRNGNMTKEEKKAMKYEQSHSRSVTTGKKSYDEKHGTDLGHSSDKTKDASQHQHGSEYGKNSMKLTKEGKKELWASKDSNQNALKDQYLQQHELKGEKSLESKAGKMSKKPKERYDCEEGSELQLQSSKHAMKNGKSEAWQSSGASHVQGNLQAAAAQQMLMQKNEINVQINGQHAAAGAFMGAAASSDANGKVSSFAGMKRFFSSSQRSLAEHQISQDGIKSKDTMKPKDKAHRIQELSSDGSPKPSHDRHQMSQEGMKSKDGKKWKDGMKSKDKINRMQDMPSNGYSQLPQTQQVMDASRSGLGPVISTPGLLDHGMPDLGMPDLGLPSPDIPLPGMPGLGLPDAGMLSRKTAAIHRMPSPGMHHFAGQNHGLQGNTFHNTQVINQNSGIPGGFDSRMSSGMPSGEIYTPGQQQHQPMHPIPAPPMQHQPIPVPPMHQPPMQHQPIHPNFPSPMHQRRGSSPDGYGPHSMGVDGGHQGLGGSGGMGSQLGGSQVQKAVMGIVSMMVLKMLF